MKNFTVLIIVSILIGCSLSKRDILYERKTVILDSKIENKVIPQDNNEYSANLNFDNILYNSGNMVNVLVEKKTMAYSLRIKKNEIKETKYPSLSQKGRSKINSDLYLGVPTAVLSIGLYFYSDKRPNESRIKNAAIAGGAASLYFLGSAAFKYLSIPSKSDSFYTELQIIKKDKIIQNSDLLSNTDAIYNRNDGESFTLNFDSDGIAKITINNLTGDHFYTKDLGEIKFGDGLIKVECPYALSDYFTTKYIKAKNWKYLKHISQTNNIQPDLITRVNEALSYQDASDSKLTEADQIDGYEGLKWGATLKEVEKKFSDLVEMTVVAKTDKKFPGSKIFAKEYYSGPIKYIFFTIWHDQLVAVEVDYDNSKNSWESLNRDYIGKFGEDFKTNEENNKSEFFTSQALSKIWKKQITTITLKMTIFKFDWKDNYDYLLAATFLSNSHFERANKK